MSDKIDELRKSREEAKRAWDKAVEVIRKANDAVGVAHRKWISADKALTEATIRAEVKADIEKQGKN